MFALKFICIISNSLTLCVVFNSRVEVISIYLSSSSSEFLCLTCCKPICVTNTEEKCVCGSYRNRNPTMATALQHEDKTTEGATERILDTDPPLSAAFERESEKDPLHTKENEQRVGVDQLKAYIRTAFSNWRKQSSRIYRLITDSENIQLLKTERDILGVFMEDISSLREAYQQVQPTYDNIHQTIETIEHADHELAQRLSDTIVSL